LLDVDAAAVIEAPALVGRTLRVYWPQEDAWFLGTVASYNSETGEHHVDYIDGDQQDHVIALERVKIMITQGAELPKPSPAAMNAYCTALEQRAARIRSTEPQDATELLRRAAELRSGTSVGAPDSENRCSAYRPGDVVWAKCRSFPPWPAMVVTRTLVSSLFRRPPAGKSINSYPIVYFGSNEYEWRDEKDFTPMREGIDKDYHLGKTIKRRLFAASICELTAYMADGEVPELMFPCNDEFESDDEEEEDEEEGDKKKGNKKKGGSSNGGRRVDMGKPFLEKDGFWSGGFITEPGMPLKVGKTLTVFTLGRVEWLHPSFHDEKSIWPVGYKAERVAVTPAAGSKKPKRHLCEILEAEDGSGPIFRYVGS
jgi:PWWP domain/F/Y-rich N-terminus